MNTKNYLGLRVVFVMSALLLSDIFLPNAVMAEDKIEADQIGEYRREGIDVVQPRVFRKGLRHEFTIGGGTIPNNQFIFYETIQAHYTFHFRETIAFEGMYMKAFHQDKDIIGDLANIPCPSPNSDLDGDGIPDTNCGVNLNPAPDPMKQAYFGNIIWSPIYGKFAIFSKKIFHFDVFLLAGAGMFDNERSNRFAFNVGGGGKIFLNDWLAVRLDFRNITVREGAPFSNIVNNQLFSLGVSFFLPPNSYKN